jgi:hypothetical protein
MGVVKIVSRSAHEIMVTHWIMPHGIIPHGIAPN